MIDIHHWLNHRWAYPSIDRIALFKVYINSCYSYYYEQFIKSKDISEEVKQ